MRNPMARRKIEVVPHDPAWARLFEREARGLVKVFGPELVAIHHIGSTAIPGIRAKPIIDVLLEVRDIERVDAFNEEMIALGYRPQGEFGIPGRRFFIKGEDAHRTHHLHAFETGSPHIARHLNFRDYLIAHPAEARAYSRLKQRLARQFPHDIEAYMDGKDGLIKEAERKAAAWASAPP